MPLQNRVTPFGDIIAPPARGMFTGNRGNIHAPEGRRLTNRRWASNAWLVCICDYQGRRRQVMSGRTWTELFFLDEATALAAAHRPCFECRRDAARAFRGGRAGAPSAKAMDAALHAERLKDRQKRLHCLPATALPVGVMVAAGDTGWLWADRWLRWSPEGDTRAEAPGFDAMLTPPSTLAALRAGYRPVLHPYAQDHEAIR